MYLLNCMVLPSEVTEDQILNAISFGGGEEKCAYEVSLRPTACTSGRRKVAHSEHELFQERSRWSGETEIVSEQLSRQNPEK